MNLDVDGTLEYNQAMTALGRRKVALALAHDRIHYVHNFGILQHTLGLVAGPPWTLPLVDYPPGFFDPPSMAPDYDPYPAGSLSSHPDRSTQQGDDLRRVRPDHWTPIHVGLVTRSAVSQQEAVG